MANTSTAEPTRRDFLYIATGAVGAVGATLAVWPFVSQLKPDAATLAAGAPVDVDLKPVAEGQTIKLFWRGKLIFVRHRTKKEIDEAQKVNVAQLPDPASDASRVKAGKEQYLIVYGSCTHLGCVPLGEAGDYHGWFCPCHGSHYDTSGRIRKGPAPLNLPVPPYAFTNDTAIRIG
ncbi:MAG: ubiquinol-cytochrome c reductase iron-sulfur subunit [Beijerinckiaceae bacterium]